MTDDEFAALIQIGGEQRHIEFKSAGSINDRHLVHRVVRAMLGMTNRQFGGYVVLGIDERNGAINAVGISDGDLATWTRDALADKVAPLVDPSIDFDLEIRTYEGRRFVLIRVREFDETPVFSRSSKNDSSNQSVVLREGALYVRGRRKPETIEIRSSQEMRDLLDLALRKRLRNFTELMHAARIPLPTPIAPSDGERFSNQLQDLERSNSEILDRIRSRCYWEVGIRPVQFAPRRIGDYGRLEEIIRESFLSLRGWDFPHMEGTREAKRTGEDWLGEEYVWRELSEVWRIWQSGQFVSVRGLPNDWQGNSGEVPNGEAPVGYLPLWDTIYRFTEAYEFAARLALTEAGDAEMHVQVTVENLGHRVLVQDHPRKTWLRHYEYAAQRFSYPPAGSDPISREDLIASPRTFAADAIIDLFQRFGFKVTLDAISAWQEEF